MKPKQVVTTIEMCSGCNKYPVFDWGGCWTEVFVCDCVNENGKRQTFRMHAGRDADEYIAVEKSEYEENCAQPTRRKVGLFD